MEATGSEPEPVLPARAGDPEAFACLVERYEPGLRRFCTRLAGGRESPDDLVQETLLRAFRALPNLADPARFEPWLLAIAANLARTWWRRQARWPISLDELALTYPDVAWEQLRSPSWSPDRIVEEDEQRAILQRAIESLPAQMGRAVSLHYLDGLNYEEVAAALEVPVSTVKGRLFKSRRRLRTELLAAGWAKPEHRATKGLHMNEGLEEVIVDSLRTNLLIRGRLLLLKAKERERFLSITIGQPEADAIAMRLQGVEVPRPLSHDLMLAGFRTLGGEPTRVVVHGWENQTFFAEVHLARGKKEVVLDARPSDAVALAVRAKVPIHVASTLLERFGVDSVEPSPEGGFKETERVKKVYAFLMREVMRFGRAKVGSDLLLIALLAEGKGIAAKVLADSGVDLARARAAVVELFGFSGEEAPEGRLPDPANPELPELMREAARELSHRYIGTEHLLLGMLAEEGGPANQVLDHLGVRRDALRAGVLDALRALAQETSPNPVREN